LTLTVEEEAVRKARELGLNISKVCENALVAMINRIESDKKTDNPGFSVNAFPKRVELCGYRDLALET